MVCLVETFSAPLSSANTAQAHRTLCVPSKFLLPLHLPVNGQRLLATMTSFDRAVNPIIDAARTVTIWSSSEIPPPELNEQEWTVSCQNRAASGDKCPVPPDTS